MYKNDQFSTNILLVHLVHYNKKCIVKEVFYPGFNLIVCMFSLLAIFLKHLNQACDNLTIKCFPLKLGY